MRSRRQTSVSFLLLAASAMAGTACLPGCGKTAENAPAAAAAPAPVTSQAGAQLHLEAAKTLSAAGKYDAAVDEYTAALESMRTQAQLIQHSSQDADVLLQRGEAFLKMGFSDTAAADFTEVLRLCPGNGTAYAKRGEAYARLGDLYKAVRDCTDAIRSMPENAQAYRFRGQAYLGRGQFERSAIDLEHSITLEPALEPEVRPLLARAYRIWGERLAKEGNPAAGPKLAKARELDPTYVPTASSGATATTSGAVELTAAKQVIDEAREQYERGLAFEREGRYDDALTAFTAAIDARHAYTDAYLRRAETLMALRFPDTAVKDLEQALYYGGDSVEAYRLEAKAFVLLGNQHRAVIAATNGLHADPTDAATYAIRGTAYVELGQWDRSIVDLEEAIRRDASLGPMLKPALERAYQLRQATQTSAAAKAAAAT
jgi:tetratricopeptide (TPR) repeat protein